MRDCNGIQNGDLPDKIANQNAPAHFLPNSSDMSSVEMLLINIQGLIKMAADKLLQREQQTSFEKGKLYRRRNIEYLVYFNYIILQNIWK